MVLIVIYSLKCFNFVPLQLDSADEQAAAIRRELDGRMQKVNEMERVSQLLLSIPSAAFPASFSLTLISLSFSITHYFLRLYCCAFKCGKSL